MEKDIAVYDIAIFGNYTKDTIVSPSGTRYVDGGGFNYGAHAAALLGLRVAAVTRLAREDFRVVEALEQVGIDVFATATSTSTHMRLEYPTSNLDDRVLYCTKFAGPYSLDQFEGLRAKAFIINASIRDEVPLEVIQGLREKDALLVADVQGFIRVIAPNGRLVYEEWPEKRPVLSLLDALKTDAVEAEFLTGETNIKTAAHVLADYGPREVVLTHRDGLLVYADGQFHEVAFFPEKLVGRSGRGDTCISAYIAKRFTAPPAEATIWAAAVTSLKMESEGPIRRELHEVEDLIARKYRRD
ncbi:MAG: PfkB family carbohydrate kinase [Candidatus Neomarinimicrobiota bacterium]